MNCPKCGSQCERDEVDVGVGIIYGPYGCYCCGWSESPEYDGSEGLSQKEQENPDWLVDPCGGMTRKPSAVKKLHDRIQLDGDDKP